MIIFSVPRKLNVIENIFGLCAYYAPPVMVTRDSVFFLTSLLRALPPHQSVTHHIIFSPHTGTAEVQQDCFKWMVKFFLQMALGGLVVPIEKQNVACWTNPAMLGQS